MHQLRSSMDTQGPLPRYRYVFEVFLLTEAQKMWMDCEKQPVHETRLSPDCGTESFKVF